jgi:hypothetical protein
LTRRANQGHNAIVAEIIKPARRKSAAGFFVSFFRNRTAVAYRDATSPNACRTGVAGVPPSEPSFANIIGRHARTCRPAAWAEIHDRTRPPVGIGFAPEMIGLRSCCNFISSEKPMTAYLISLALVGLIAIAIWEGCS